MLLTSGPARGVAWDIPSAAFLAWYSSGSPPKALRTRSPQLWLGPSLNAFMREIGLNPDNGGTGAKRSDARRLRDQLERLFRARISFEFTDERRSRFMHMDIAEGGELWWDPKQRDQVELFESWITLGGTFYEALIANPVPADLRALRALKSSPLALDLYTWLAYGAHRVTRADKPVRVTWKQLMEQIGSEYADPKDFRDKLKTYLARVLARAGSVCLDRFSGLIGGVSAGFRPPRSAAAE
jgi:hypothetical protein